MLCKSQLDYTSTQHQQDLISFLRSWKYAVTSVLQCEKTGDKGWPLRSIKEMPIYDVQIVAILRFPPEIKKLKKHYLRLVD